MPTKQKAVPNADPMAVVRSKADALYRGAVECCRQHDRAARISETEEPELEHKQVDAMCAMCDGGVEDLANAYHEVAGQVHPEQQQDEAWWHKANALWHASREYARRHAGCEALAKRMSARHNPDKLAEMQMEYELEASALLALRHAADAYLKTRPGLT